MVADTNAYLGIDAGSSSTVWRLMNTEGKELARGAGEPLSANQLRTNERAAALAQLTELVLHAAATAKPTGVVAGVTALEPGSADADTLAGTIAGALGLAPHAVRVMPDIHTAYLTAFRPGEGVVVYAGTGSIAFHLGADGDEVRAGGHGYLIDDAGGGFWIGRQALKRVLRRSDELGASARGPLASGVYSALGGSDWAAIRNAVYAGGRSKVASLTKIVAEAAAQGDEAALSILAAAGTELARLARVVSARLGRALPVVLTGGVARCGTPLTDSLAGALPAHTTFAVNPRSPVEAAAELARGLHQG